MEAQCDESSGCGNGETDGRVAECTDEGGNGDAGEFQRMEGAGSGFQSRLRKHIRVRRRDNMIFMGLEIWNMGIWNWEDGKIENN